MLAEQRDVGHREHRRGGPRLNGDHVICDACGAVADARGEAELVHAALGDGGHLARDRVIEAEDRVIEREAHQTPLGLGIRREIPVPVQVIRRDVEDAGDRAARLEDRLDLEGRELEDNPVGLAHRVESLEHGHADVAAEMDALTGTLEDRRDQRGGGRLAVGAGDPADARAAALEDQVHLAAHRNTMGTRDLQLGASQGTPGAWTPISASAATSSG